jgi:glycerate kinase
MKKSKILVAPTEFKESLNAGKVANTIAKVLTETLPREKFEIIQLPVSDGGDGFLESIQNLFPVDFIEVQTPSPYSIEKEVSVKLAYAKAEKKVYVESAKVLGLKIVPKQFRNPLFENSYGLGIILKLLDEKNRTGELEIEEVVIGLGGSATQDL